MNRIFYIIKSSIELFLFGLLCLALFLDMDEYLLIISIFIILATLILLFGLCERNRIEKKLL